MFRRSVRARDFLVAESPAMRAVVESAEQFADTDVPVLISGEHGTGSFLQCKPGFMQYLPCGANAQW